MKYLIRVSSVTEFSNNPEKNEINSSSCFSFFLKGDKRS